MICKSLVLIIVMMAALSLMAGPVTADLAAPPNYMSVVHIEKGGMPFDGPISYTLTCYQYPTNTSASAAPVILKNGNTPDSLVPVYSVSHTDGYRKSDYYWDRLRETCRLNGSANIEKYCETGFYFQDSDPRRSEVCQLTGSAYTTKFSVWNDTDKPVVQYAEGAEFPRDYYEFFFTLTLDNQTQENAAPVLSNDHFDPVGSLWCSLLHLFGGRCE